MSLNIRSSVAEAIEPMRLAMRERFLQNMEHRAEWHERMVAEARAEIRAALESTPGGERPWRLPEWCRHQRVYSASLEAAAAEMETWLRDPYCLAGRLHTPPSRAHSWACVSIAEGRELMEARKAGRLPELAEKEANLAVWGMVEKLTRKVEILGDAAGTDCRGTTLDCFVLTLRFARVAIRIYTNLVWNNRNGRDYPQWPSRIYLVNPDNSTGRLVPAVQIKELPR